MKSNFFVSIVSPFYNEEATAAEFCNRVRAVLDAIAIKSYEIIAVNDGSTDATGSILNNLAKHNDKIIYMELATNRGQALALFAGIQSSKGDYVVIMDSDLQHLPEEIPLFLEQARNGFTIVSGKRVSRKESILLRRFPSWIANKMIQNLTGCKITDQGGFKCIKGDIVRKILIRPGYHRFLPAIVFQMGGSLTEVPISAPLRQKGKSNYGISRIIDVFLDILMLWFESSGKSRPLYLLGKLSIGLFVIASFIVVFLIVEKVIYGFPVAARPPFYLAILLFIISAFVFFQSLMLEIISNIYRKVSKNYSYVENKKNYKK
jgi:glycosyltransferase involved in cell wall biosynthesis